MYTKSLLLVCVLSQVTADRNLPVLFQFSQPSHNVAVYRGADLERAKAAGLIKGFGGASASDAGKADTDSGDNNDKYTPPPTPAPTSAPVVYKSTAPPKIVYTPSPRPAPVTYKPAPIVYRPAPTAAPVTYKPAPVVH